MIFIAHLNDADLALLTMGRCDLINLDKYECQLREA